MRQRTSGFTLLELMIVVSILGIVASIGVPQYSSALRIARVTKAKQELRTIAQAIDSFTANNGGQLPLTLYEVGYGGRLDPWGTPYCYLNYGDGTGDGLQWAVDAGLVDPSAVKTADTAAAVTSSDSTSGSGGSGTPGSSTAATTSGGNSSNGSGNANGAGASGSSGSGHGRGGSFGFGFDFTPGWQNDEAVSRAGAIADEHSAVAIALAASVSASVSREVTSIELAALTSGLSSVGGSGIFTGVAIETTRRRDRYMFPLNTDYDLFSLGPDARTTVSLGETVGLDDVIRANNGGFFGTASEY